jgi:poly(3-hydroxybutyrate) depolymerase
MAAISSSHKGWSLRTGHVLRRVLRSDPAQEYFLYVPSTGGSGAPLLVAIHGISRNSREQAKRFSDLAETHGVVLVAPHFSEDRFSDYQRLGREGRGTRADLALANIVEEVAWLTKAATTQFYLFGFSGGAQFAHRYAMGYPDRVAGAVIAAAGWYTFPDAQQRFPYGIRPNKELPKVRFDPEEFLRIPFTVIVGEHDTEADGVRRTERVDTQQGTTRIDRARNWVAAMQRAAQTFGLPTLVAFQMIRGGSHSFEDLMDHSAFGEQVFESLFGPGGARSRHNDTA